ncbi:fibrobacter succinogenes major paralogous domain-containing protein [Mucilaginibacter sp.]|uniref:fibrobacter succinogenes major paralogous domain-containing protein n=1 Tax=Mucilaginibacter sp. TaxID=1882438 RepID=UPI0032636B05
MKRGVILLVLLLGMFGCKKNKPTPPRDYTPAKTALIFPAKDEACNTGTTISDTKNTVIFRWNGAENAERYELVIKNLATGIYMVPLTTFNTQIEVTLTKNTPYSWYITATSSRSNNSTKSDVWKFYNSGPGFVSHAPFPTDLLAPALKEIIPAAQGKITLNWSGSDVDNDIVTYDVYFGTSNSPPLYKKDHNESILYNLSILPSTTYYWKVVAKDSKGNTSDSEVSQFLVGDIQIICGQPYTDPRDGITYNTVNINGGCWLGENLKYTNNNTVGINYGNSTAIYNDYGRLYSFNEVINSNIAPPGWHVPTYSEVDNLSQYLFQRYGSNYGGTLKSNTSNLWAPPNSGANNVTGFNAIPSGYYFNGIFDYGGYRFYMWTSTSQGLEGGQAFSLYTNSTGISVGSYTGAFYFAVRCVKN